MRKSLDKEKVIVPAHAKLSILATFSIREFESVLEAISAIGEIISLFIN